MNEALEFPNGLTLLGNWQAGDVQARAELLALMNAALAGDFDANFRQPVPDDRVHVSGSVHMITLSILNDLYGLCSREYYKTDPWRYVRANLIVSRLLGIDKLYMTWALYAFSCEALGQEMMYPDKFPPGSDPDKVLITKGNWRELDMPNFNKAVPLIITEILRATEDLTGMQPLLQLSAPYSLAADIYGQEPLLADVVHDPDMVNALLDHLADRVLNPWIEHFFATFPNGWVELSDASGSPFFIGPQNSISMAIRAIRRMVNGKPWGHRVFDANYRGDFVTQAKKTARSGRRRGVVKEAAEVTLQALTEAKCGVCPDFLMRLEADKVPVEFYQAEAVARRLPLTCGIGSSQVDRNSIPDLDVARADLHTMAISFTNAIKSAHQATDKPTKYQLSEPWPSHVYFEDISAESQFELIRILIETVHGEGAFT